MEIVDITTEFYHRMFARSPGMCPLFNEESQRNKVQHRAFAEAAMAYVDHKANDVDVEPLLQRIAQRHCALDVRPEQYGIVHDNFVAAVAHLHGDDAATPWSKALHQFAGALIERERALYETTAWRGCRAFRITEIVEHGTVAKSITLAPVDGDAASVKWTPGQFVTVVSRHSAPRHYTVSSHNRFRITPKIHRASASQPGGRMTRTLDAKQVGDVLMMHAPFGTFTLDRTAGVNSATPLAFVAGGIGITPVVALAGEARSVDETRPIALFHCASTKVRPLVEQVPSTFTVLGARQMIETIVPMLAAHSQFGPRLAETHFFLCAPHAMMRAVMNSLTSNGIDATHIHCETFESHTR